MNSVKISNLQATLYITTTILPTALLFVPSIVTKWGEKDAWISLIIALDIGLLTAWVASKLAMRFPEETIIQFAKRIVGRYLGAVIGLLYVYFFFFLAYATQRQFAGMMTTQLLPETPMWFIVAMITVIVCYVLYAGLEPLVRANFVIFMVTVTYTSLLMVIALITIKPQNFMPVLSVPFNKIFVGSITPGSWLTECAIILMLLPFIKEKDKAFKITASAVLIVTAFMFVSIVITIGVFNERLTQSLIFPSFTAMQVIVFEEIEILDFLDVVIMSIWVFGMAFKIATALFAGTYALAQLMGVSSYRVLIIPGGILTTILAVNSWQGVANIIEYSEKVFPPYLITTLLILPAILLLIVKIKDAFNLKMDSKPGESK